jgi:hypothetical protein
MEEPVVLEETGEPLVAQLPVQMVTVQMEAPVVRVRVRMQEVFWGATQPRWFQMRTRLVCRWRQVQRE